VKPLDYTLKIQVLGMCHWSASLCEDNLWMSFSE